MSMNRVQVDSWAEGPRYVVADRPPAPASDELQLRVLAAGLHLVVRARATGTHYSAHDLPHVPGVDCVARHDATGQLYYCSKIASDFGTFADYINIARANAVALPAHVDPVAFAASYNPAMSSWMAITQRTADLPANYSVLIIGATSASGRMAVHAAKALGAATVTGIARNADALAKVQGLDQRIVQASSVQDTDLSQLDCDLILDYVYGDVALHVLSSLKPGKPVQYVQIGSLGQTDIALPSAILRSKDVTLRGAGPGAWSLRAAQVEMPKLVAALAGWELLDAKALPMKDIRQIWNDHTLAGAGRLVVQP
ncbi:NADPH:quinone reductase [Microdochium nivale]|nr:NADPH:quinone reductase [Microdochium nivale]